MSTRTTLLPVERHRGLIDVYMLVGLPRGESDPQRIHAAIAAARAALNQEGHEISAYERSQLPGYLSEAERILTDAVQKAKYDASLRRAIGAAFDTPTVTAGPPPGCDSEQPPPLQAAPGTPPTVTIRPAAAVTSAAAPPRRDPYRLPSTRRTPWLPLLWDRLVETAQGWLAWFAAIWAALHGGYPIRFSLAILFALGMIAFGLSRLDWNKLFPESTIAARPAGEQTVSATLSAKPAIASIPGQRVGIPRLIPGLEGNPGYAPTLSAALTEIVFVQAMESPAGPQLDLCFSAREKLNVPFGPAQPMAACNTADDEFDPTLAPDGLEVLFVRTDATGRSSILQSVRSSVSAEFSEPAAIEIPGLPSADFARYDALQLVGDGRELLIRVTTDSPAGVDARYYHAWRTSAGAPFGAAVLLPVFVDDARHFLSSRGLRAFICRAYTIQLDCRPTADAPFSPPSNITALDAGRIGHPEGPIWVAPAEDFLFYSVTEFDASQTRRRFLKQVRFR